jgi:hypothetical protein
MAETQAEEAAAAVSAQKSAKEKGQPSAMAKPTEASPKDRSPKLAGKVEPKLAIPPGKGPRPKQQAIPAVAESPSAPVQKGRMLKANPPADSEKKADAKERPLKPQGNPKLEEPRKAALKERRPRPPPEAGSSAVALKSQPPEPQAIPVEAEPPAPAAKGQLSNLLTAAVKDPPPIPAEVTSPVPAVKSEHPKPQAIPRSPEPSAPTGIPTARESNSDVDQDSPPPKVSTASSQPKGDAVQTASDDSNIPEEQSISSMGSLADIREELENLAVADLDVCQSSPSDGSDPGLAHLDSARHENSAVDPAAVPTDGNPFRDLRDEAHAASEIPESERSKKSIFMELVESMEQANATDDTEEEC